MHNKALPYVREMLSVIFCGAISLREISMRVRL